LDQPAIILASQQDLQSRSRTVAALPTGRTNVLERLFRDECLNEHIFPDLPPRILEAWGATAKHSGSARSSTPADAVSPPTPPEVAVWRRIG
jgi:hypothetical protein